MRFKILSFILLLSVAIPVTAQQPKPAHDALEVIAPNTVDELELLESIEDTDGGFLDMALSYDETLLAVGTTTRLLVYDLDEPEEPVFSFDADPAVGAGDVFRRVMLFTRDNKWLLAASGSNLLIINLQTGDVADVLDHHEGIVSDMIYTHQGEYFVSAGYDGRIYLMNYSFSPWIILEVNPAENVEVEFIASSPTERFIAAALSDGSIRVYNTSLGALRALFFADYSGERERVTSLAYRPDGLVLAAGSEAGVVYLWDLVSGSRTPLAMLLHNSEGVTGAVEWVGYSPTGALLVTAGDDGVIRFWSAMDGKFLSKLTVYENEPGEMTIAKMLFSADGKRLYTLSERGIVHIWGVPQS